MLKIDAVSYHLEKQQILDDISFEAADGELLCLLGPSGSGKTSILRLIAGLAAPDNGTISINGVAVSSQSGITPPHKRNIGYLFQDFALFPHLNVMQNIQYGLTGVEKSKSLSRTRELLDQVKLQDHAEKFPHMLSGGEQQRVALARAIASRPRLLLLDEPFSSLDTSLRQQVREETIQIAANHGLTTIMVTHDPDEAMSLADRIVLINEGAVVQIGTPEKLYNHPVNKLAAAFFGNINKINGIVENEQIKTDIGSLPGDGLIDGSKVDILIRPEGIKISPAPKNAATINDEAWVCGIRYCGNSNLVRVGIGSWSEPHTHMEVSQLPGISLQTGDKILLEFDRNQTYVFPKT
ncbi:MAG: ABC transporter ATP-binding protein [Pseudomonadota bacterium]|nr:ABC transporter ATP-binding protein [Pseudomonadota bacterium]